MKKALSLNATSTFSRCIRSQNIPNSRCSYMHHRAGRVNGCYCVYDSEGSFVSGWVSSEWVQFSLGCNVSHQPWKLLVWQQYLVLESLAFGPDKLWSFCTHQSISESKWSPLIPPPGNTFRNTHSTYSLSTSSVHICRTISAGCQLRGKRM